MKPMPEINYKNLAGKAADDDDILSAEDEKIRALLNNLNRVEAPNGFDFRVRARIARQSRAGFQPRFLPVLRYFLPLGLIILFSAAFVFKSLYFFDAGNFQPIAENDSPVEIEKEVEISPVSPTETTMAAALPEDKTTAVNLTAPKKIIEKLAPARPVAFNSVNDAKVSVKKNSAEISGGTHLSALSMPKKIITPPGITLEKTVGNPSDVVKSKSLTVKEVLSQLGIETIYTGETWKVLSVQENSLAKRSGVKTGDAVKAIDDEKLTDKPLRSKTVEGKKITIVRGAQKLEISLGN